MPHCYYQWRDMTEDNDSEHGYPHGMVSNPEADDYLSGILYVGYRGHRLGVNHYMVGHIFQNRIAHDLIRGQDWFPWRDSPNRPNEFHGGYYSNNPYTNW